MTSSPAQDLTLLEAIEDKLSSVLQRQDFQEAKTDAFSAILQHLSQQLISLSTSSTNQIPPQPPPVGTLGAQQTVPPGFPAFPSGFAGLSGISTVASPSMGVTGNTAASFIPSSSIPLASSSNTFTKIPKLQLTAFDGGNPLDWIFKAEQFFNFHQTPPAQRLEMIAFYMSGDALSWFKWMFTNQQLTTWPEFTRALTMRFGPSCYENPQQELFKLKQITTVQEYQSRFERLCNQVIGLSAETILNCFISGLSPAIKSELAILRPYSVSNAIGLAKLVEAKLKDTLTTPKPSPYKFPRPANSFASPLTPKPPTLTTPTAQPAQTPTNQPKPSSQYSLKRLTPTQMQERRALGLCYNCDEKYVLGHRCQTKPFLLLLIDEEVDNAIPDTQPDTHLLEEVEVQVQEEEPLHFQLSDCVVHGVPSPKALKFNGTVLGHNVRVLVDTGSTHNVIPPRIAAFLRLPVQPIPSFSIMVGNGAYLTCSGLVSDIPLMIKGHIFRVPFHIMEIQGADLVLGLEWLRTLGPTTSDYAVPYMTFQVDGAPFTLTGEPFQPPTAASFNQLQRMLQSDVVTECLTVAFTPTSTDDTAQFLQLTNFTEANQDMDPTLWDLLKEFESVFSTPQGLPPPREHDHHITLLPNSSPVNVRPYRYPHTQKEAMAALLSDMLKEGIVKPSTSSFSSPVLLIKKKDGSWQFCVDYRSLNSITIKDKFPIPTIDELLDELGGSTIYTKIDLRSGFHQIRVVPEDTHKTAFQTVDGHYEFLVMPFGLTNAPSTFQHAMNDLLRPFLRRFVLVFFDDILIYSPTFAAHLEHLRTVLRTLLANKFYAKLSKCDFGVNTVHYLGHVISASGVGPDPNKIQAILD
ncbi:uncharacterized protein LOC130736560 [Lotus japonicus]|uniref:uncharacterized protein LOC130736560 n=1 Tax=Lotus japonicus TaxID=34305 RepID=UPI00258352D1|nr:uncharacterized protein LOC130736560 [Lotus japonicus]